MDRSQRTVGFYMSPRDSNSGQHLYPPAPSQLPDAKACFLTLCSKGLLNNVKVNLNTRLPALSTVLKITSIFTFIPLFLSLVSYIGVCCLLSECLMIAQNIWYY